MNKITYAIFSLLATFFTSYAQLQTVSSLSLNQNVLFNVSTCPDVTDITVPAVTNNSATFNWLNAGTSATSWDIAVGPASTNDPTTLPFANTLTVGQYTAVGLENATSYKVYIRSVCGTDKGTWIGPILFKTDCNAVASFTENFDTTPALTLPGCWSKIVRGQFVSPNANVRTIALYPYSGTNSLQLQNSGSTGEYDVIAVSPRLSSLSVGTYRIKFQAKGEGVLELGTIDNATNSGTFNSLTSITTTALYDEYTYEYSGYIGTDTHIGIRLASLNTNSTVYIDNIIWEIAPLCPDVSGVAVNNLATNTATINWGENLAVETWNIAIGAATETNPSSLPLLTSTTQGVYNASGLIANTNYKVWVRSVCGENSGAWIGPIMFKTNCEPAVTFNENFDTTTVTNLPSCWTKIIRGATVSTTAAVATVALNNTQSAPNAVQLFNANSTGNYDIILVSPLMQENLVNNSRVKFYAKSLTESSTLQVVTLNSNSPTAEFTVIQTIEVNFNMSSFIVNLDAAATTDNFVGFRLNATSDYKTIYLDNISIEPIPTCVDVSNIIVTDVLTTSATLSWTEIGSAENWEVVIGSNSVTDPNTLTALNAADNYYIFEDLTASTYYKVWVRSICPSQNGAWIGPISFSTSCNPATTLNENFDSTTLMSLPICWNSILRFGAVPDSDVSVSYGGMSGTFAATLYAAETPSGGDIILVTPELSNINGNQTLTFSAEGSNNIEIGTLDSTNLDATFTVFQTYNLTDNFQTFTVDFSTYTGTDTFLGFRIVTGNNETSSQYIGIDNVVWAPNLNNDNFDSTKSVAYPNPVNDVLNIKTTKEFNSVTVYNVMGQQVLHTTQNLSQINMSGLSNGAYFVKLNGPNFTETLKVIKN